MLAGRYDEALQQFARTEELAPGLVITRQLVAYSPRLDVTWDPIRGDPRWTAILRAVNLGDYLGNARKAVDR